MGWWTFLKNIDLFSFKEFAAVRGYGFLSSLTSPPVAKATGFGDCCKYSFILGVKACLPIRCLPAAVSQSQGMAPVGLTGMASTIGTAAVPAATVAILAATLGWDLAL